MQNRKRDDLAGYTVCSTWVCNMSPDQAAREKTCMAYLSLACHYCDCVRTSFLHRGVHECRALSRSPSDTIFIGFRKGEYASGDMLLNLGNQNTAAEPDIIPNISLPWVDMTDV